MKGFILKFRGSSYKIGVPEGVTSITANVISHQFFHTPFRAGGLKTPGNITVEWVSADLDMGDEIEVEMAESDEASIPVSEELYQAGCHGLVRATRKRRRAGLGLAIEPVP